MSLNGAQYQAKNGELCIEDSGATHTILKSKKYFFELKPTKRTIDTISGPTILIDGVGKANVVFPNGTQLLIENALFSPKSKRNLLSFRNIYHNRYDTRSRTIGNEKYLHIINENQVFEKLPMLHSGLHYTHINVPQAHMAVKEKYCDPGIFSLWHDRLGHPGSTMMKRIIENAHGHPVKDQKFPKIDKVPLCTSCSLGKLIARPSPFKVENESSMFLERIQGDICGPIHPPCGPFRYFMVLIDASSKWSHVSLLSTRNVAFAKFLAQIIKLRAHFPDYTLKRVRLDNAGEFTSHAFNDYCMSVGIIVEHPVAHVHTQNGLAESLIKRLQLIARPLIMRTKLPVSMWGHVILHAASLILYVPIAPPQRTKMGPQRRLGIYVGYDTSSIIRYIEPLTGDLFTACFADCHFDEAVFLELGGLPDAFIDTKRVTKSHIPAANAPARVEMPNKQAGDNITQESQKCLKRGRPIGSKDKNPRKRKGTKKNSGHDENVLDGTQDIKTSHEEEMNDINKEMSINYSQTHILWDRNEIGDIDEIFSYSDKWKDAMQAELNSLNKRNVFGPIVTTHRDVKHVGYRWIFVRKRNDKNEVTRYKARLVAQGFSQRPGIDYKETYSPVMDAITFRYLISIAVFKNLEMRRMDVVTAYLYGSIDNAIYMKIPEGFKIHNSLSSKPREMCSIKLKRSLYGLKQSGRMWYNRLSDYLISKGYINNLICPCVFIKKTMPGFVIIAVYVDDLNIIGTNKEIQEVIILLKKEFEMKDLGKTKYCIGLQIEHMHNEIIINQSNYTEKLLKRFNMDKAKPLSIPMVGRSLNVDNDPF
ncbi:disease resistance CC-NBS-LRR class family protein [Tanacetum coccineum]